METKQQMLKAIEELPDDASVEDALERLYLFYKIEKGIKQADAGELISQEEARQRMAKWLKEGGHRKAWRIWRRSVNSLQVTRLRLPPSSHSKLSMLLIVWPISQSQDELFPK